MSLEKIESITRLNAQIEGMENILSINSYGIIDDETERKIGELINKAKFLKNKLKNNEFEIAIVGPEKAGKSTFANAMMGIDILPSRDARCTYTSTSIEYGGNYAEVEFFSYEEFKRNFSDKLKLMGIQNAEDLSFRTLSLEGYQRRM